MLRFKDMA